MAILKLFEKIVEAYQRDYGQVALPGPASQAALKALERKTSLSLPADLRALLLEHDGAPHIGLLPDGAWLCNASQILQYWEDFAKLADQSNEELPPEPTESGTHLDCVFHRSRLPFASREDFYLFLDFAPGPTGVAGQVLMLCNEVDLVVVGNNLTDFFRTWLKLISSGEAVARKDPDYWRPRSVPRNWPADWGHYFLERCSRR